MLTLTYTRNGTRGSIVLDVTVSETHDQKFDVTSHPVEKGANISDHVRALPVSLRVECMVTDYPLPAPSAAVSQAAIFDVNTSRPSTFQAGRANAIYARLAQLAKAGVELEVSTGLTTYPIMVIDGLSPQRTKDTSGAVAFTMTLREIVEVGSQTVPIKVTKVKAVQSTDDKGNQTGTAATDADRKKSILLKLIDNASDAFKKAPVK